MNTIETGPSNNARDSEVWSRSWTHFRVDRCSPRYCHVAFGHPPINRSGKRRMDLVLQRFLLELGFCFMTDGLPATGQ